MSKLSKNEEITKQTYDRLAASWSASHISQGFWQDEMSIFNEYLPKGTILEVGAGGGRDARELLALGYDYLGTDISGPLLEQARRLNPAAKFKEVSLYDLNFKKKFDGFWCAAVLLHIPKDRINEALEAIKKNLKPGAIGFIAMKPGKGQELRTRNTEDSRLFAYWEKAEFLKVLEKNGLSVLKCDLKEVSPERAWLTYIVKNSL